MATMDLSKMVKGRRQTLSESVSCLILGCPAGPAFQHAAMLVTQLIAGQRPAPLRAPTPVPQPRDEAGRSSMPTTIGPDKPISKEGLY